MTYKIGIDIGGTKINAILLKNGKIIKKIRVKTERNRNKFSKQLIETINELIKSLNKSKPSMIGVGIPGIFDEKKEKIIELPNLKALNNFNLKKYLYNKFKIPIKLENDSLCSAVYEYSLMKRKPKSFIVLTIGTGIGGGAIINGKKISITEPGHLTIKENHRGNCGNFGCLEEYAAAKFLKREAKKKKLTIDPKRLSETKAGKKLYQQMGKNLGIGLSDIIKLINPEMIVLSGGLSKSANLFLPSALKEIKKRTFFKIKTKISVSKNIDNAGALGAALL